MKQNIIIVLLIIVAGQTALGFYLINTSMNKTLYQAEEFPAKYLVKDTVSDLDKNVFEQRRRHMAKATGADIIMLSTQTFPDFRYFTGFDEKDGIAVFMPNSNKPFRLFVTPWEIYTVMWTGEVYGIKGAIEKFGADTAYALSTFEEMLPELLKKKKHLFIHADDTFIRPLIKKYAAQNSLALNDISPYIHEARVFKCQWETQQVKLAVDATVRAHKYVMQIIRPGLNETDIQAYIEYVFRRNGMNRAFPSIVGSGPNACLLHHTPMQRTIQDGDLVLIDIGAKSPTGYASDITRTIPANGTFSPEQRTIYELVLKAHSEAIKLMSPDHKMLDCHHRAMDVLTEGLYELGLITDTASWWQKRFYLQHRVNHYIGLQTHDVGDYGYDLSNRDKYILNKNWRGRKMKPGMIMSLEPGLYFMEGLLDGIHEMFGHLATKEELEKFVKDVGPVYKKYEGIGVRIEDVILITESGCLNLSEKVPRTVDAIENFMQNARQ